MNSPRPQAFNIQDMAPFVNESTYLRQSITPEWLVEFIKELDIPEDARQQLLDLTPATYTGNAADQAVDIDKFIGS